jgi:hypothetical protein
VFVSFHLISNGEVFDHPHPLVANTLAMSVVGRDELLFLEHLRNVAPSGARKKEEMMSERERGGCISVWLFAEAVWVPLQEGEYLRGAERERAKGTRKKGATSFLFFWSLLPHREGDVARVLASKAEGVSGDATGERKLPLQGAWWKSLTRREHRSMHLDEQKGTVQERVGSFFLRRNGGAWEKASGSGLGAHCKSGASDCQKGGEIRGKKGIVKSGDRPVAEAFHKSCME